MLNRLIAFVIFAGIGVLLILAVYKNQQHWKKKYDQYPKISAKTWADCDTGHGYRWVVQLDLPGKPYAVDYTKDHGTTFHPEFYHLTEPDERVTVYYWKVDDGKTYHPADEEVIPYFFHFCQEDRYEMQKTSERHTCIRLYIMGGVMCLAGLMILLS